MVYENNDILFDNDMNTIVDAFNNTGVLTGCGVTTSSAMTVAIASGTYIINGTKYTYSGGTQVVTAASSSNPRKDIIYLNASGLQYTTGTAAAAAPSSSTGRQTSIPIPPTLPSDSVLLAEIWVETSETTLGSSDIEDLRIFITSLSDVATSGDHVDLANKGTNTHTQIDSHISNTSNPHSVDKTDVGLSNVPNTDCTNASNITTGTLSSSVLPPVALTEVAVYASEALMLAATTEEGDVAVRSDLNKSYMHNGSSTGTMADWTELQTPTDSVLSVNGETGTVVLTTGDITEDVNDRFVTDAQLVVIGNTSGTNTGDQDAVDVDITDSGSYYTATDVEGALQEIRAANAAKNDNTGFPTKTTSTITFTDGTRTFSIQPTATNFEYYEDSVLFTSTGDTVVIDDTEGIHIIYYNNGVLTSVANPSEYFASNLIMTKPLVSIVYWNATDNEAIYVGEERHGMQMDGNTHAYLHYSNGLVYRNGLGLNTMSVDGTGITVDAQFGIDAGGVSDEDLGLQISAVTSTTGLPIYHMTGSTVTWNKTIVSGFSARTLDNTSATRLAWNEYTGGAWQLTEATNNDFVLCHIFATTEKDNPMIAIMGQNEYNTKSQARTGAQTEINELVLNDIMFPEIRPIGTVILQTNTSYTSAINAKVVSTDEGDNFIDWRNQVVSRVELSTDDHNSLTNLQGGAGGDYYHLTSVDATKVGHLTVTQAVDLDTMESDVSANTAKVSYPGNADATELNILDGATLTTTELNYVEGVTSAIQTQLNACVKDTGNETIAGIKTFSSFPVTPSSAPTTNYQTANKKYVDDNAAGGGGAPPIYVTKDGEQSTGLLYYIPITDAYDGMDITEVRISLLGLPTGSDFEVDVRKNGTASTDSIFTSDAEINIGTAQTATNGIYQVGCSTSGSTVGTAGTTIDSARDSVASDDVLFIYVTQVGSTITGTDLKVVLTLE